MGPLRPPAVLVMGRAPRTWLMMARAPHTSRHPGGRVDELESQLGPERWVALQELLLSRAVSWASDVAPGAVYVAYEPVQARSQFGVLLGPEVHLFVQNGAGRGGKLANAAVRALAGGDGPLLVVWPDLPNWCREHAESALGDLRAGCALSVGPVFDGGFYLLALARPLSALLGLPERTWRSPEALATVLAAAHEAGAETGLLRPERGLHSPEDVRAALADPLLDSELRRLLQLPGGPRP